MTDRLAQLLAREADALDAPAPPASTVLARAAACDDAVVPP